MIMMYQGGTINYKKYATLVARVNNDEAMHMWRQGAYGKVSVPFSRFYCENRTVQQKKAKYLKILKNEIIYNDFSKTPDTWFTKFSPLLSNLSCVIWFIEGETINDMQCRTCHQSPLDCEVVYYLKISNSRKFENNHSCSEFLLKDICWGIKSLWSCKQTKNYFTMSAELRFSQLHNYNVKQTFSYLNLFEYGE